MNTPPDNEFPELRRLLRLKRHEQPPPGYFNKFSNEVIVALKDERRARRQPGTAESAPSWILKLVERFQSRPGLAGVVGVGLCSLVIGGILLSESQGGRPAAMPSLLSEITPAGQTMAPADPSAIAFQPVTADSAIPLMASNSLQPTPTLFDSIPGLDTATVNYR